MPFGEKVKCIKCEREESLMWHRVSEGVQCNECLESEVLARKATEEEEQKPSVSTEKLKNSAKKNARTTRSYKTRQNPNALPKQSTPKGKGRRHIFKKTQPVKLQAAPSTYRTVPSVVYNGMTWKVGDVVSVRDEEGDIYYAQLSGLMIDQYCEKSASIWWLVPKHRVNRWEFNPFDYTLCAKDNLPHSLDNFEFVMRSPLNYFLNICPAPFVQSYPFLSGLIYGRLSHLLH